MNVAGIDAHSTYLVVAIVSKQGERLVRPRRIENSEVSELLALLDRHAPTEVVVETSPAWPWLHDLLQGSGHGFVLAHAKKLRGIAEQTYKRDEVDAELLARMRVAGLIPAVYAKTIEQRDQAVLVRHRATLVRERTSAANRIHGQIQAVGLRLARGRLLTEAGRRWVRGQAWPLLSLEQQHLVRTHFKLIDDLTEMIRALDRRIEEVAAEVAGAGLLQTIPGIGPYRSLLIATEVLPINRFSSPGHLVSYAGLAPRSRKSGVGPIRMGSTPAGANRWLRGALVQAVVNHCQHAPDSWLSKYYERHKERRCWQVARVATARKLTRAIHAMLRTGEVWRGEQADTEPDASAARGEFCSVHVALTTRQAD
jgi:transposase